jgi:1,2-diacylglycerol 3-alpha-glucosyltransferase
MRMKILFIYENMYAMGGIQTWLSRVAPGLRADGHEVALLTRPTGEDWDSTSAFVEGLSEHAAVHLGGRRWFDRPGSFDPPPEPADILFACNLPALLRAALLQRSRMPTAKVVAAVFHPSEYCWQVPLRQRRWREHVGARLVRRLPPENFMFSTDSMRQLTGTCLGRDLSASPVLPLPVDTTRFSLQARRRVDRNKVVSVTRLSSSYAHHAQMIDVIRELRDQGRAFTYHAYGDGEQRAALESKARRLEVSDAVFFHGTLPYDRFTDAVGDAFAYMGFGTALVEAAACGVPALVGIDPHPGPATYGFFQDTEGNDLGGRLPGQREFEIKERLLWLADRTEEEYRRIELASRARAEEFSLELLLPRLVELLERAARVPLRISEHARRVGYLDWLLGAALLRLGAPDAMNERFIRRVS